MHKTIIALASIALLQACSAGPMAPVLNITGQYQASSQSASGSGKRGILSFMTTENGQTTDWLSAGASVLIELRQDGTTSGTLALPGIGDNGNENADDTFRADLTGTWSIIDGKVHLAHSADTFLRDMQFTIETSTLTAEREFDGVIVRLVLIRTS